MKADLTLRSPVPNTFRTAAVRGRFDLPSDAEITTEVSADLPLEGKEWNVGAIVGSSGTGKSSLGRHFWPDAYVQGFDWPPAAAVVDCFPEELESTVIGDLLIAVGLSSTPTWIRPYATLSTGQRFRAEVAQALAHGNLVVMDEFTSVVDRTVAKSTCVSVSKHVRRNGGQFIALSCHRDILPWLECDWFFDTDDGSFHWGRLQRPPIDIRIWPGHTQDWIPFRGHHYLSAEIHKAARLFVADVDLGEGPVRAGFFSVLAARGQKGWWRGHRIVVLPDFQGLGIGNAMIETIAEQLWVLEQKRVSITTSAPNLIRHWRHHPEMWRSTSGAVMQAPQFKDDKHTGQRVHGSTGRLTTRWQYVPTALRPQAAKVPSSPS